MGFGRYRLPAAYIAERAAAGLGLPDGALQLGRHTLCDRVPEDLLVFLERHLQSRRDASTVSSLNSSTSTNASNSTADSTASSSASTKATSTAADDIAALPWLDPADVAAHDNDEDGVWIVLDDLVLDVTVFQDIHPGGSSMFCRFAGGQCGKQFRRFHHNAAEVLDKWRVLVIGRTTMPSEDDDDEEGAVGEGMGASSPPSVFNPMVMLCL